MRRGVTLHIGIGEVTLFKFDVEESLFTFMWRGVTLHI
jgi:hypothetical protein